MGDQPPQTLVLLAARLRAANRDARPLMTRVVLAYPTDFWANTEMGNAVYAKDPARSDGILSRGHGHPPPVGHHVRCDRFHV